MDATRIPNGCLQQLFTVLHAYGLTVTDAELVRPHVAASRFDKGEHLHRAGEIADSVYFICEGLVRFYYITADGKELNKSFSTENQFAGALHSSVMPQPARFSIEALETCATLSISLEGLTRLYTTSLAWANLGRLYNETLALKKAQREASFLLDSAEQRYRDFIEHEPALAERLPLYHIASYLGITDVALSRIRKRILTDGL